MNDGGPAFPTDQYYNEERVSQHLGMSLRDYLAGQIAAGMAAGKSYSAYAIATYAYQVADEMLRVRKFDVKT